MRITGRHIGKVGMTMILILGMQQLVVEIGTRGFLAIPWSASIPGHVFWVVRGTVVPQRGLLVAFRPPRTPYAPSGMWWMKYIAGLPGDAIVVRGRDVWVHGIWRGHCAKRARQDHAVLQCTKAGIIPAGYVFVWGTHPRSFDSRYAEVGLINEKDFMGHGIRLF